MGKLSTYSTITPTSDDKIPIVDDPGGTPVTNTVTVDVLRQTLSTLKHCAKMTRNAAQSIPDAENTKIAFDNEEFDIGGLADTTTDKFTIQEDGRYLVTATVRIGGVDDGEYVQAKIYINGSVVSIATGMSSGADRSPAPCITDVFDLSATDYIELYVYQDSGGAQDTHTTAGNIPRMSVVQI